MNGALREAEFGNTARAHEQTMAVLASVPDAGVAGGLGLCAGRRFGPRTEIGRRVAKGGSAGHTSLVNYWLPTVRAAIEIDRNNPSKAIEFLEAATPLRWARGNEMECGVTCFIPCTCVGRLICSCIKGAEAATEFHKFIDHPTMVANNPLFVLAHLGMARAYALQGQRDKSRAAYQQFFNLWKDADPDIPIYNKPRPSTRNCNRRECGDTDDSEVLL